MFDLITGIPIHPLISHAESLLVLILAIVFSIWFAIEKSERVRSKVPKVVKRIIRILVPILAIGSLILTVLVGHSGAEATWKYRVTQAPVLEDSSSNASAPVGTLRAPIFW